MVNGKSRYFDESWQKLKRGQAEAWWVIMAKYRPEEPLHGSVELVTKWCIPKRETSHRDLTGAQTKPGYR